MLHTEESASALATRTLDEAVLATDANSHPNFVRELVSSFHAQVGEALAAGAQLEADRAELRSKSDLIPAAGAARLHGEALAEAETKAKAALQNARNSVALVRRAGLLGAQPQVDKEREGLAREELSMLVGEGTPAQLMTRIHRIATVGSRDAVAALSSSFGKALLETKGLEGRDLDDALDSAKRIIAETAVDNPTRHTESELKASALYRATGEMDGAVAAASAALGLIGVSHA